LKTQGMLEQFEDLNPVANYSDGAKKTILESIVHNIPDGC